MMDVQSFDSAAARQALVDCQVRVNDVTDKRVIAAFRKVPREAFAPAGLAGLAYSETDVEVAPGRWLWRARDSAKLIQALEPVAGQSVLIIGAGLGYTAALLAELDLKVTVLEADEARAAAVRQALAGAGYSAIDVQAGDLRAGVPGASFDMIYIDGGASEAEKAWLEQLNDGGRLGLIVRNRGAGRARIYRKSGGVNGFVILFEAAPPMLPELEPEPAFKF
jgi:protein-L-isoaspartate(D-aspartate) O-methyltransferase